MQFIPLVNLDKTQRAGVGVGSIGWIDCDGFSRSVMSTSSINNAVLFKLSSAGTKTAPGTDYLFPYASSAENINYNTTSLIDKVGSSSIGYNYTTKGWDATITITAPEGTIIRHLLFVKKIQPGTNAYITLLFAIKLDSPVTIDSTGTANFTFAIEF